MLKLNIGSGKVKIKGFTPIDRRYGTEAYPLEHETESVDEIRASHILEHFGHHMLQDVLREWKRVLKSGTGVLRIAVPDLDKILEMRSQCMNGAADGPYDEDIAKGWPLYLMGGQGHENDYHRSQFTKEGLTARLLAAGFDDIEEWVDEEAIDTASHPVSLRLKATKPVYVGPPNEEDAEAEARRQKAIAVTSTEPKRVKVAAVMSIPRLGFNDAWGAVLAALTPFQIPVRRVSGAFWDQCMQNGFEGCIKDGVDWILTIDYDSLFSPQHLNRLMEHLANHPEIDAIAPLQCRRGRKYPLITREGAGQRLMLNGDDPVQVDTAHFGLTIIRAEDLAKVPKPWFKGEPGSQGTYADPDRCDADIWFWRQWKAAGKSVYLAPDVRIGHIEMMVSQFNEQMEAEHHYVHDWQNANDIANVEDLS